MLRRLPVGSDGPGTVRTATWTTTIVYHRRHPRRAGAELVTLARQPRPAREVATPSPTLHATFSDDDLTPHAGHMFAATVHVVAELHLRLLTEAIMTRCPLENSEFVALKFD